MYQRYNHAKVVQSFLQVSWLTIATKVREKIASFLLVIQKSNILAI